MNKGILATKVGMTQIFTDNGICIPVTVLEAGPCPVVQVKTEDKEGYNAIQIGFLPAKLKNVNSPLKGHFEKSSVTPVKILKELRLNDISSYELGQEIKADIFASGEKVDISGTSKGKGFQGNIKRHGFSRGPSSHGSKYHRGVGALSAGTTPGRVHKGRKLPGQMGNKEVTVQNLEIIKVDPENNCIIVKGAVPGPRGSVVLVKNTVKA